MERIFSEFNEFFDSSNVSNDEFKCLLLKALEKLATFLNDSSSHIETENANSVENELPIDGKSIDIVIDEILKYFRKTPNYHNGLFVSNVIPPVTKASVIAKICSSIINPNLVVESYGGNILHAEQELIQYLSILCGYDPKKSGGYATYGGSFGNYWSLRIALEKRFPEYKKYGHTLLKDKKLAIIQSNNAHYTNSSSAQMFGVGYDNIIKIITNKNLEIDLEDLEKKLNHYLDREYEIFYCYMIFGATDTFAVDSISIFHQKLKAIFEKRSLLLPHVHIDASVGWVNRFFDFYDLETNPLILNRQTMNLIEKIRSMYLGMHLADSISIDGHKLGYVPYPSSFILLKNKLDLSLISKNEEETHYFNEDQFKIFPGAYTYENSRSAEGILTLLANLHCLGIAGYQKILITCMEKIEWIKSEIERRISNRVFILNKKIPGVSCVFRFYEDSPSQNFEREYSGEITNDEIEKNNENNFLIFNTFISTRKKTDLIFGYSHRPLINKNGKSISGLRCVVLNVKTDERKIVDSILKMANNY